MATHKVIIFVLLLHILVLIVAKLEIGKKVKVKIESGGRVHKRYRLSENNPQYPQLEEDLYNWILEKRDSGMCVTGGMNRFEALRLANTRTFGASNGWFTCFLRRRKLVVRRITISGLDLSVNCGELVTTFLYECERKFMADNFNRDSAKW